MLSSVTGWRTLAMGILPVAWSRTGPVYPANGARIWRAGVGGTATEAHHSLVGRAGRTASTLPWLTSGCRMPENRGPPLQRRLSCGLAGNGPFPATPPYGQ
jgi:hypothetical protein